MSGLPGSGTAGHWRLTTLALTCLVLTVPAPLLAADGAGQVGQGTELTWYGYLKLDMAYDSAVSSHGNYAMWVKPHAEGGASATQSITARQTRVGVKLRRQDVRGLVEFDFYGGGAENKNALQLRKAYVDLPVGPVSLRAGQDADVMSPLVPATINYTVCWGVGNIGYRRPQLRLYQTGPRLAWAVAVARNITDDLDGNGIVDGEDSTVPLVQGRLAYTCSPGGRALTLGGSGHYGVMDSPAAADEDYRTWSANGEVSLALSSRAKLLGEAYVGSNLATYFGSILNANRTAGLDSRGGWVNLQYKVTPLTSLSLGASADSVDEDDLTAEAARSGNRALFGNLEYEIGPGVTAGVELSHWSTKYPNAAPGTDTEPSDLRLQIAIQGSI